MCNFFIRRKKIEDHYRWPTRSHSIQIIPLVCVIATKTLVTRFYAFHYLIKQILTFYDNSNFVFFLSISVKKENWTLQTFFVFSFSFPLYSPHSQPDSPHSHPLFSAFPPPFPAFPAFASFPLLFPAFPP